MKDFKNTIYGFFCFFITSAFNISLGILIYSLIEQKQKFVIAILILLIILLSALICTLIDYFRRKIMISRPLNEILSATEMITKGNFNIRLTPNHSYQDYDEFDLIKDNINRMVHELSKNEILKNDFIANVSHEIKTPLSVIQTYANELKSNSLSEQEKEKYLDQLQFTTRKLTNLVTNILKLNKLENQKLNLDITTFNLSECLTEQILQYEDLINQKELILECDIEENLFIRSEQSYLELVFNNLVSNAIKFNKEKGKINISLKKQNESYIIEFKDTGCGMDKETGMHIFEKFYQGDTSHSKQGNGLGLALVKRVIDVLGGSINVISEVNVGTTFIITIKEV